jgi:hypothetical protein
MPWCDACTRCVEDLCTSCVDKVGLSLLTLVAVLTGFAALTFLGLICSQIVKRCFVLRRRPLGWSRIVMMIVLVAASVAMVVGSVFPLYERPPERIFRIVAATATQSQAASSTSSPLFTNNQTADPSATYPIAGTDGSGITYTDRVYSMLSPCDPNGVGIGLWVSGGRLELTTRYLGTCTVGNDHYPRRIRTFQGIATVAITLTVGSAIALFALADLTPACVFAATALFLQMVLFGLLEGFFTMTNFCHSDFALHQLGFERGTGWMAVAIGAVLLSVSGAALFVAEEATMRRYQSSRSVQTGAATLTATTVTGTAAAVQPTPVDDRVFVRRRNTTVAAIDGSIRG